ncbi:MAG TPA: hypothetical protein VFN74_03630 [Chloroflexota bacterium]|nr:hypothetical protein [Chloroflexota bacterium]
MGATRSIVLVAVVAVLLVSGALFVIGVIQTGVVVVHAAEAALRGEMASTELTVEFLGLVSTMKCPALNHSASDPTP